MFLEAEPSKFVGDKTDYLEVFNELAMGNMPMTVIDYSEKAGVHLEIRDNNPCDGKQSNEKSKPCLPCYTKIQIMRK